MSASKIVDLVKKWFLPKVCVACKTHINKSNANHASDCCNNCMCSILKEELYKATYKKATSKKESVSNADNNEEDIYWATVKIPHNYLSPPYNYDEDEDEKEEEKDDLSENWATIMMRNEDDFAAKEVTVNELN